MKPAAPAENRGPMMERRKQVDIEDFLRRIYRKRAAIDAVDRTRPPPASARVDAIVSALPRDTAALVIRCAERGERPDWGESASLALRPMMRRGRPLVVRTRGRRPYLTVLRQDLEPASVLERRQAYAIWHAALADLAVRIEAAGVAGPGVEVVGPQCPAAPWRESADAPGAARSPRKLATNGARV